MGRLKKGTSFQPGLSGCRDDMLPRYEMIAIWSHDCLPFSGIEAGTIEAFWTSNAQINNPNDLQPLPSLDPFMLYCLYAMKAYSQVHIAIRN